MAVSCTLLLSLPFKTPKCGHSYNYVLYSSRSSILNSKNKALASSNEDSSPPFVPRLVDVGFRPCVWGDHFITTTSNDLNPDVWSEERHKELKRKVKQMLDASANEPMKQTVNLIHKIQRLGISYHFQTEIENTLKQMYDTPFDQDSDLYDLSLRFRLLRQAAYYISPEVFNKFKDENGEFQAKLSTDVEGMLCLYEAAHLSFIGEDVLDEAIGFTTKHLKAMLPHLSSPLAKEVQHALDLPLHKRIPRLEASHYILMYQEDESRIEPLLEFAKLDFNMLQSLHRKEMSEVARWGKEVKFATRLPFRPRDRLAEGYAMTLGVFFEPQYSKGRIGMAKLFAMYTLINDTYDTYGTLEELIPLATAISRWDVGAMDALSKPMKVIFQELLNVCNEYEEMTRSGQPHIFMYLKQQVKNYTKRSLEGAMYILTGEMPTSETYMEMGKVTSGVTWYVIGQMMDMGESVTVDDLEWVSRSPKMVSAAATIVRLINDIKSFKTVQEGGTSPSMVACYMKEHQVLESEAIKNLQKMIKDKWKEMNREFCLRPTPVPMCLLLSVINVARMMEIFYLYGDGFTEPGDYVKQIIASMLINPIPM